MMRIEGTTEITEITEVNQRNVRFYVDFKIFSP